MSDLILAGILTWLMACVWWGTNLVLRAGRRERVVGGLVLALGLIPIPVAMWLAT